MHISTNSASMHYDSTTQVIVNENDSVTLTCKAIGIPVVIFAWLHNQKTIVFLPTDGSNPQYQKMEMVFHFEGDLLSTLIDGSLVITFIRQQDGGWG